LSTGIKQVGNALERLKAMLERGQDMSAGFARIYPLYQKLQVERFQTENASEGEKWKALNSKYEVYKTRRYGGGPRRKSRTREAGTWKTYPGNGTKMLIGTTMLAGAVIGPNPDSPFTDGAGQHRAMFTATRMTISVEESGVNPDGNPFVYPHFVGAERPFMTFGQTSMDSMKDAVRQYLVRG
jgi:hypothetical protein